MIIPPQLGLFERFSALFTCPQVKKKVPVAWFPFAVNRELSVCRHPSRYDGPSPGCKESQMNRTRYALAAFFLAILPDRTWRWPGKLTERRSTAPDDILRDQRGARQGREPRRPGRRRRALPGAGRRGGSRRSTPGTPTSARRRRTASRPSTRATGSDGARGTTRMAT